MSKDKLGTIVRKLVTLPMATHGVVIDLLARLDDPDWVAATKRFIRMENPWPIAVSDVPAPPPPFWERISDTVILVNLSAIPQLPFDGATIEWNQGSGWVTVENRDGQLYVEGRLVTFHLVEGQKTGTVKGHDLRKDLVNLATLHPNIMDALYENVHLIPESCKVDDEGRTRYIFFWSVGYRDSDGVLYVRCLYWGGGAWYRDYYWLDNDWNVQRPAAMLASVSQS